MIDLNDRIEEDQNEKAEDSDSHNIEERRLYWVVDDLLLQPFVDIFSINDDADEPEKRHENQVECHEQAEETPHDWHPAVGLEASDEILA